MSKGKIAAIITASVLLLYSVLAIGLYIIIAYFAPEKNVMITVNSGALANVEDENEKWIINVEYYSNHNNTGVELLEVKLNYYMSDQELNSEDPSVYSKGIQLVGDKERSISFSSYLTDNENHLFHGSKSYLAYKPTTKAYYYDTQNGISFATVDKIDEESKFQISIGSGEDAENYLMKFLGKSTKLTTDVSLSTLLFGKYDIYEMHNLNFFLASILEVCRSNSVGYGADGICTVDFGSLFAYQQYNNGAYTGDWLTSEKLINNKLIKNFTNYFTIRIKTHENGATKASDSMFGMIQGKQNFEALSGALADNYFHGEQVITLTERDFEYYKLSSNTYQIKFSNELVERIKKLNQNSTVSIILNDNILADHGINLNTNSNSGIIYKDELYYSVSSKIGTVIIQHTNQSGLITKTEVTK